MILTNKYMEKCRKTKYNTLTLGKVQILFDKAVFYCRKVQINKVYTFKVSTNNKCRYYYLSKIGF